jgi:hypothetical protein
MNVTETRTCFEENYYFGLHPTQLTIFLQGNIPVLTYDGTTLPLPAPDVTCSSSAGSSPSSEPPVIATPNGNGGVYKALKDEKILADMKTKGIQWIHFVGVDNILVKPADPVFLGLCAVRSVQLGNKACRKVSSCLSHLFTLCLFLTSTRVLRHSPSPCLIPHPLAQRDPAENIGVFCWRSDRTTPKHYGITEYMELTAEEVSPPLSFLLSSSSRLRHPQRARVDPATGRMVFAAGNILSHVFAFPFLEFCCDRQDVMVFA